ncbi:MAG: carbohydrate binding domain-containing protein [Bacteroidota bacterium]
MRRLSLLLFAWILVLSLVACQPAVESAPVPTLDVAEEVATPSLRVSVVDGIGGYVEDFEDRARVEAVWHALADGEAETRVYAQPGGMEAASQYHLTIEATRPAAPGPTDVAGTVARLTPSADGFDARAFQGLRFALRGTPGTYIVQLGSARVDDYDHFNAYVTLTTAEWTRFEVPFGQFGQEGYGQPVMWTGNDLVHLAFFANQGGAVTFEVDDVLFF